MSRLQKKNRDELRVPANQQVVKAHLLEPAVVWYLCGFRPKKDRP